MRYFLSLTRRSVPSDKPSTASLFGFYVSVTRALIIRLKYLKPWLHNCYKQKCLKKVLRYALLTTSIRSRTLGEWWLWWGMIPQTPPWEGGNSTSSSTEPYGTPGGDWTRVCGLKGHQLSPLVHGSILMGIACHPSMPTACSCLSALYSSFWTIKSTI